MARAVAIACFVGLAVNGCTPASEAELLSVTDVSPSHVEPGTNMRISGRGFVPGETASVALTGVLHRPGRGEMNVSSTTDVHVSSFEQIELEVDDDFIEKLGGRGTFEGDVRVAIRSAHDTTVEGGIDGVIVDLVPATDRHLRDEVARARAGNTWLRRLGIAVREASSGQGGVVVERIAANTIAQRGGLRAGDRILAVNRVRVNGIADIVPRPGAEEMLLEVSRDHSNDVRHIRMPLHASTPAPLENGPLGTHAMLVLLAGLFVLRPSLRWTSNEIERDRRTERERYAERVPARTTACLAVVFACALLSVLLAAGSLDVSGIVHAQGTWPTGWIALRDPALLVTFAAYALAVLTLTDLVRARVVRVALLACGSFAGATLFLGGWNVNVGALAHASNEVRHALGMSVLSLKSLVTFVAFRWLLRFGLPHVGPWHAAAAFLSLCVTFASLVLPVAPETTRTVSLLTTGWVVAFLALRAAQRGTRMR